jgi:hypothetical protein
LTILAFSLFPYPCHIAAFIGSPAAGGKGLNAGLINNFPADPQSLGNFFSRPEDNSTAVPFAYINYIVFDERFNHVSVGFDRVGGSTETKAHEKEVVTPKNGYIHSPQSVHE